MKYRFLIGATIACFLLISMFFGQTTSAKSDPAAGSNLDVCKVKKNNAKFFVEATERNIRLRKGTPLLWTIFDMHQGLIVVKAKVGTKWVKGEILLDDTTCN